MKAFIRLILICLMALLPACATAQLQLELSGDTVAAESVIDFTLSGGRAETYRYTLYRGEKKLFATETAQTAVSYLPREEGEYTLKVAALPEETETTEAHFTVVEKLKSTLTLERDTVRAGEPLKAQVSAAGGVGAYEYVYAVSSQNRTVIRQAGAQQWFWVPAQQGEYTLQVTVKDEQGAVVQAMTDFTVENGPGISLEACGGSLGGHGGQKSWTVYSGGSWTASTTADFIALETTGGECGDVLTVTVKEETDVYREAVVKVVSGMNRVEWTVAQPAGHGNDEEVYLFGGNDRLYADGREHVGWINAQGSRSFHIDAPDEWHAESDSDFIQIDTQDDTLTLTVDESEIPFVRSGIVTLSCSTGSAYIYVYQPPTAAVQRPVTLMDSAGDMQRVQPFSQSSGYWKDKKYGASTLEHSGCAIFALSHALQCMGYEGDAIQPEALAKKYAFCLRDGGTVNATLVGNAGDDLGFKTRYDLYTNLSSICSKMEEGAVFSFAIVSGHIAMVAGQSADGSMMRIIDSAPSATWERIQNARLYRQTADGSFVPVESLGELAPYYVENDAYGGAEYWLEADYVARRGVRLIQPKN